MYTHFPQEEGELLELFLAGERAGMEFAAAVKEEDLSEQVLDLLPVTGMTR